MFIITLVGLTMAETPTPADPLDGPGVVQSSQFEPLEVDVPADEMGDVPPDPLGEDTWPRVTGDCARELDAAYDDGYDAGVRAMQFNLGVEQRRLETAEKKNEKLLEMVEQRNAWILGELWSCEGKAEICHWIEGVARNDDAARKWEVTGARVKRFTNGYGHTRYRMPDLVVLIDGVACEIDSDVTSGGMRYLARVTELQRAMRLCGGREYTNRL